MNKSIPAIMVVAGVGLLVYAFSDYVPGGAGEFAGWSDTCRYCMTLGAMLATGGRLLS